MNSASRDTAPWPRALRVKREPQVVCAPHQTEIGNKTGGDQRGGGIAARQGSGACRAGTGGSARCIVDLGGGSLEISILRDQTVEQGAQLPLGTVRLMTTLELPGVIRPAEAEQVRRYVRALLESKLAPRPNLGRASRWRLGETRKRWRMSRPPRQHGLQTMELSLLRERLPDILRRDVRERMKAYAVRRDRADVMAVAAITFSHAGALPEPAYLCPPRRGRSRRAAARDCARSVLPQRAAPVQRRSAPVARGHAQFCAADWI